MAVPTLITRDNYTTLLVRSTNPRGSVPDGNVYFDTANDRIQLITLEELATVDLGSGLEANPLTNATKIQLLALYFFALQEVEADATLQQFRTPIDAVGNRMGKLVGATAFLNAIKLPEGTIDAGGVGGSLGDDRLKIADSGFTEFSDGGGGNTLIDRVLHGAKSLSNIEATSQPFYQIAASLSENDRQAAVPVDFSKPGDVNEVIQTFGSTANGDSGAGNFDSLTSVLILGVRTFKFSVGESTSLDVGANELGAYIQGYPLGEAAVQELQAITEADVFGAGIVAPYTGLGFFRNAAPQTESGFNEADGDFTDIITNTGGASLIQIRAWLDKIMQQDTDQNDNTGVTGSFIPKRAEPLYTINAQGKLVTRQGIFIENVATADEQDVIFTDDAGATKTRPFNVGVIISLSSAWEEDSEPWFRVMYLDGAAAADFDTAGAVTVQDDGAVDVAAILQSIAALDVDTITWQSGTTVRYTFNGTPNLSALTGVISRLRVITATNASNNGLFEITAFDDGADWIEVTNAARTDATDDEATNSPAVADAEYFDSRIFKVTGGYELRFGYAYDTNTQAGLSAGVDKDLVIQVGGVDNTKRRTVFFTVVRQAALNFDASSDAETN